MPTLKVVPSHATQAPKSALIMHISYHSQYGLLLLGRHYISGQHCMHGWIPMHVQQPGGC